MKDQSVASVLRWTRTYEGREVAEKAKKILELYPGDFLDENGNVRDPIEFRKRVLQEFPPVQDIQFIW